MIKKFFAWVKSLFVPLTIEEAAIDKFIAARAAEADLEKAHEVRAAQVAKVTTDTLDMVKTVNVRLSKAEDRPVGSPLEKDDIVVGIDTDKGIYSVAKVEVIKPKAPATPPKPLDEQLKGVELPSYAQGKKLPPKAKRQFIDQARRAAPRKVSDNPTSYGNNQINATSGIDPVNAAMYGYAAATILSDDTPPAPAPVEECRSSAATSTYSSSSSSYDSSSYDSGSSYSSCD